MIKAIVNSCRFKGSMLDEPKRVQILDLDRLKSSPGPCRPGSRLD